MSNSKYEYVKTFEVNDIILPHTWMVVRIDGRNFHKFTHTHHFDKPNDRKALKLMTKASIKVMEEFHNIVLAYGYSDEYSFLIPNTSDLYNRRNSKILSVLVSSFTSYYQYLWKDTMDVDLKYPPSFDGRIIPYPTFDVVRDYFSWRQVDCHINNLYNTCFWNLVQHGTSKTDAEKTLCGTLSKDKNEILFSQFGINYNNIEEVFRKGTVIINRGIKKEIHHTDIIKDSFWKANEAIFHTRKSS